MGASVALSMGQFLVSGPATIGFVDIGGAITVASGTNFSGNVFTNATMDDGIGPVRYVKMRCYQSANINNTGSYFVKDIRIYGNSE